jgi:hypothetical protein
MKIEREVGGGGEGERGRDATKARDFRAGSPVHRFFGSMCL